MSSTKRIIWEGGIKRNKRDIEARKKKYGRCSIYRV